jgi:tRNA(fMet)-specific endonuclease VapC
MLDTNICIFMRKRGYEALQAKVNGLPPGSLCMSVITWGELITGAEKSQAKERTLANLQRIRQVIPVLDMNDRVGDRYGEIRGRLEMAGTPIGVNDNWIAAHALTLGLTLVTDNTREFTRVPGLAVENWAA